MMRVFAVSTYDAMKFARSEQEFRALEAQIAGGLAWKVGKDGKAFALFGLYRTDSWREAWFRCEPQAQRYMLPLCRIMRRILKLNNGFGEEIRCAIKPGYAPGERIAVLCGFQPMDERFHAPGTPVDGVQFWRYEP